MKRPILLINQFHFFIALVFCFFGFSVFSETSSKNSLISPRMEYKLNAVWQISNLTSSGTGFFIEESDWFLTSFSVLNSILQNTKIEHIELSKKTTKPLYLKVDQVLALSAIHDLALLRTQDSMEETPPLDIKERTPILEEDLLISGYLNKVHLNMKKVGNVFFF